MKCDFSGYATRANVRCSDGRVILKDAFIDQNGSFVPIVWNHQRNDPENVLGRAKLEHRDDGVYAYGFLNNSKKANDVRVLLEHGDITGLSIFATQVSEAKHQVSHGVIRELSIVIGAANPGAYIEKVSIQHGDEVIDTGDFILYNDAIDLEYSDEKEPESNSKDKTAEEIFNTLNEDQKKLFYAAVTHAASMANDDDDSDTDDDDGDEGKGDKTKTNKNVKHSDEGDDQMKYNPFEGAAADTKTTSTFTISHSDEAEIFKEAQQIGSLKQAVINYVEHSDNEYLKSFEHGIEALDVLFPEARTITNTPEMIMRQQEWVSKVWNAIRKSPFSRVKTIMADITMDEARAKGYIKGKEKQEEQFGLLKRVTTPQTVYKKQKLDRDDILDITTMPIVAWLKGEMRMMLMEELARAALVSDGRSTGAEDKINENNIRPIYKDEEIFSIHKLVKIEADDATREEKADAILDAVYEAREDYRGSGSPTLYCPANTVTTMLLARDQIGRRLYNTVDELASALRVREIVEVPVMDGQVRETGSENLPNGYKAKTKYDLLGIIVNLTDYTIGSDKGGEVTLFDDFDINFNKEIYLIETRCSGALYRPKSAIVLEKPHSGE